MSADTKCCDTNLGGIDSFSETLQQSIDNIIKEEGYVNSKVYKKMISTEGGNYLGQLFEVDVKGKTASGDKKTNIFVKRSLSSENTENFISINDAYFAEMFFYNELSKIYIELQEEANVPQEERYKLVKSYNVSNLEAIFLQNIAKEGFETPPRMEIIPLKYAELCMQQLAKFHGLSFVLQNKRPEYFDRKLKSMKQPFVLGETFTKIITNFCTITLKNLDDEDSKKKVENFIPILLEKYPKHVSNDPSTTCCLCHGDYRHNNILKKEINGEVTEVIPVDYQLLFYGSPITDILFFMYLGTDREFRKKHMTNLKNLYHDTLGKFLQYFDMDVEDVYPKKRFDKEFDNKLEYGLIISTMGSSFIFVQEDDAPDFDKDDLANLNYKLNSKFQGRYQGVLDEFEEWGYF